MAQKLPREVGKSTSRRFFIYMAMQIHFPREGFAQHLHSIFTSHLCVKKSIQILIFLLSLKFLLLLLNDKMSRNALYFFILYIILYYRCLLVKNSIFNNFLCKDINKMCIFAPFFSGSVNGVLLYRGL